MQWQTLTSKTHYRCRAESQGHRHDLRFAGAPWHVHTGVIHLAHRAFSLVRECPKMRPLWPCSVHGNIEKLGGLHARHVPFQSFTNGGLHSLVATKQSILPQSPCSRRIRETVAHHRQPCSKKISNEKQCTNDGYLRPQNHGQV